MNRLYHIKKTLIKNIKNNISYSKVEFVLLDYNSKDGLEDWVYQNCKEYLDSGILKYHKTTDPLYFHMSDAKNLVHNLAKGDILCNLDADNFTNKNFAFYLNFNFRANKNIIMLNTLSINHFGVSDFGGRIGISKENFIKLNGYDQDFIGWGYEDVDFKHRAFEIGLKPIKIQSYFLKSIWHSDKMRDENMPVSKMESIAKNKKLFIQKRSARKANEML